MLRARATVSPSPLLSWSAWTTPSASSVLKVTSAAASSTQYASIGSVIDQMMTEKSEEQANAEEEYTPYEERPETYLVPIVFLLILVIGLTGNGVLALTILRHSNMRNVPNIYVFSLALGDLLARDPLSHSGFRPANLTLPGPGTIVARFFLSLASRRPLEHLALYSRATHSLLPLTFSSRTIRHLRGAVLPSRDRRFFEVHARRGEIELFERQSCKARRRKVWTESEEVVLNFRF